MKKDNPMLKKALEEAARQELKSLPEEKQIIRPYSDKFEKDMHSLLNNEDTAVIRKRPRVKIAALIAAVLVVVLTAGVVGAETIAGTIVRYMDGSTGWTVVGSTTPSEYAFEEITYKGGEIVINYETTCSENANKADAGIIISLNGIRQTFDVKSNGDKVKNVDIYNIEAKPGETQRFQFSFTPNTGKKGELISLCILKLFDPEGECCSDLGIMEHLDEDDDEICDKCSLKWLLCQPLSNSVYCEGACKVTMAVDAPEEEMVCKDFSGMTVSPVEEIIRDCYNYETSTSEGIFNEYDKLIAPIAFIYNDFENQILYDKDAYYSDEQVIRYTTTYTEAKENAEMFVNIHGKGGKYRVCFYVDTEIQPVFDGCEYVDIEFADGEQAVLNLNLDTRDIQGQHKCFVLIKPLDNVFDNFWDRPERAFFPDTLIVV